MTLASVREFVLSYVPRKVSTEPDSAEEIIFELALFWEFLDRDYKLPEASSIIKWLRTGGLVARLKAELSNTRNVGMAKSMIMLGNNAGYDMTTEEGLADFISVYNQSLAPNTAPQTAPQAMPPGPSKPRVGRNELCPCGSGKKFKKCCR